MCIFKSFVFLQENIPLAPLTTIKIGGLARYFVEARSIGEVQEAVALSRSRDLPVFVLGGGSNLLIADSGWPGSVLKIAIAGIEHASSPMKNGKVLFEVGAGESWDKFVSRCRGGTLRWRRMPQRNSRQRGRHAGAERRRLRAGSFRDDRVRASARFERWSDTRNVP